LYLPSRPEEVSWGPLPNASSWPVLTVRPGQAGCVDTICHEGLLADQGSDPRAFFGAAGIPAEQLLDDVVALADSGRRHQPGVAGAAVPPGPRVGDIDAARPAARAPRETGSAERDVGRRRVTGHRGRVGEPTGSACSLDMPAGGNRRRLR
jgi:hypothetical protein